MKEIRNVLVESARIARGNIRPLSAFNASEYDAMLFPGGFGAAKNLSDWAFKGTGAKINPDAEKAVREMAKAGKPIGALCISPVILARILGDVEITVGDEYPTIKAVESLGARHHTTKHGEIVIDKKHKLVTTPCYMLSADIVQVGKGIDALVKALIEMI
jgi:enhancing lycopene biosynthesis protein 2